MKMIDEFTNLYPVTKTLRFSLIPVGKTEENFVNKKLLEEDEQRAADYQRVKGFIDRYHKKFIEDSLNQVNILDNSLNEYSSLYFRTNKSDEDKELMQSLETGLRVQIARRFKSNPDYQYLFKKEMITQLLPNKLLTDEEEIIITSSFNKFTTYFIGFHENRENMYSEEPKATAISYRIVNENLPKHLDNVKVYAKIRPVLGEVILNQINNSMLMDSDFIVDDYFTVDYFNYILSESGIEKYNNILGGYSIESGEKIQGLNELINIYNQKLGKEKKSDRLPKLKPLYKQILSDRDSISYIPEQFSSDDEVISSIIDFYTSSEDDIPMTQILQNLENLLRQADNYDFDKIFYDRKSIITLSANVLGSGSWNLIREKWNKEFDSLQSIKALKSKKYDDNRDKVFKRIESFSISHLSSLTDRDVWGDVTEAILRDIKVIYESFRQMSSAISVQYQREEKLSANSEDVQLIKSFLDSFKQLEADLKPLRGSGKEENKDEVFYGDFVPLLERIRSVNFLYNRVRNYVTKKPYSTDKIKLNFQNPQLLGGWDNNKISDYRSVLLRKNSEYYLAIMDKSSSKVFNNLSDDFTGTQTYELMNYKLLPGPNKMLPKVFFAKSNLDEFHPSSHILEINEKGTYKKGASFNKSDCIDYIDFFQKSIRLHKDWSKFGFVFKNPEDYNDISEFYKDVSSQGYMVRFESISADYIDSLVDEGKLYLFKIYNKDFSTASKRSAENRTPNLHTLYFKMLFDDKNLENVVYKLNGQAEMFYRKSSISESEMIIHPANEPIKNKNSNNPKRESKFEYDLIKDRRFTKPQFMLHLPITMNYKADGNGLINEAVRKSIKQGKCKHIIGIDRGERNLLYVSVIDNSGSIILQESLNIIHNKDVNYDVDYHDLLDRKEAERKKARQSWSTIENIKNLKEGYLSQAVKRITDLVIEYDAIVVMEDLNSGFKNSRVKVEKQVYQKFEKMLIDKLNYLVDKKTDVSENGGLLHAYQLTQKFESFSKMSTQNGIIFYVPAWLTSKIDPVTGFVDLLKPKYSSAEAAKEFINSFDSIAYDEKVDMFCFSFNYKNFPKGEVSYVTEWSIYSNGTRIRTFRNPDKNNEWDNERVDLSTSFKALFEKYEVNYSDGSDLIDKLQSVSTQFYKEFLYLLSLVLQMRNSVSGNVEEDSIISPVMSKEGEFFETSKNNQFLPENADANGAYNIARKGLWVMKQIEGAADDKLMKVKLNISNKDWLALVQGTNE